MNMTENPTHVYWRQIAEDQRSSLSVLCSFVPERARVLDLGIGSGALGRQLREQLGCELDGVTINAEERSVAAQWYQRIELLDLDQPGWDRGLQDQAYDVVVCADVLEHLQRPERVLAACRRLLRPEGVLLVSIPNVAYAGLVADLMHGNFEYGNEGLMDRTHLRFFTRSSFQRLLASQGWSVERVETIDQPLHETEFTLAFDALPPSVARHLLALPDANAYQLVFVARPAAQPPLQSRPVRTQHVSAATFVAQLFVAAPEGFCADRKVIRLGTIGLERQILKFEIPAALGPWPALRLDPADRAGFFWLHRISLRDAAGQPVWSWSASEAGAQQLAACGRHQIELGAFDAAQGRLPLLMLGDDPFVELPIGSDAASRCAGQDCTLEVECGWPMSADYLAAAARFTELEATTREQAGRIAALQAAQSTQPAQGQQPREPHVPSRIAPEPAGLAARARRRLRGLFGRDAGDGMEVAPQPAPPTPGFDPTVEIVMPIYGSLPLVQRCLRSVQNSRIAGAFHLTLINDGSPDPAVREWLHAFAVANPGVTVVENARNLGFVETVNLGMRLAGRRDVVLLNSDTEVANDWLDRLRAAAWSAARVGTVTPFSNNATICSYPEYCVDNPLPPGEDTASMDRVIAATNRGQAVDIPTAVGFCMYIRRACLDDVGEFDAASFGQGYGEENDFCLRASALGWRHLHALDVFVYHEGGASFKETRHALQARALETIRRLHPGYEDLIREFVRQDPARPFREAIDRARGLVKPSASAAPEL
jgi:GT2 family glycosyltransferase/2-polyprenyl-3-methyl-5-hydroxy-6-metoxy-1,4-benzoquinol methylase